MIEVKNVTKVYGQRTLWSEVCFDVKSGEMVALVGPSGCGKSTLLNCVGLLEPLTSGDIAIDGRAMTRFTARQRRLFRRDTLGYLFQNYALIDNATVNFNLRVAVNGQHRKRRKQALGDALQVVGMGGRGEEMIYRLSGGEQQRVALARLLVKEPSLILADEPTGALDSDNADMVISTLRELAERGASVIIATHSKIVESNCDTLVPLRHLPDQGDTQPDK